MTTAQDWMAQMDQAGASNYEKKLLMISAVIAGLELLKDHDTKVDLIMAAFRFHKAAVINDFLQVLTIGRDAQNDYELIKAGPDQQNAMLLLARVAYSVKACHDNETKTRDRFTNLVQVFEDAANG